MSFNQPFPLDLSGFVFAPVSVPGPTSYQMIEILGVCHGQFPTKPGSLPPANDNIRVKPPYHHSVWDIKLPRDAAGQVVCPCRECMSARSTQRDKNNDEQRISSLETRVLTLERLINNVQSSLNVLNTSPHLVPCLESRR
jgi:hypothetical protein